MTGRAAIAACAGAGAALVTVGAIVGAIASARDGQPDTWQGLPVAERDRCSPYDPHDYEGYRDIYQRLKRDLLRDAGGPVDAYTLDRYAAEGALDIDHRVARVVAHDSGLCAASIERRAAFARDPGNMALAHWYVNRDVKRSKDAAAWLPPRAKCEYARAYIETKREYGLSVERAESGALERALRHCDPEGT